VSNLVQLRRSGLSSGGPLVDPQARRVRYLRVSLTDRCNYRCTYCMPAEGLEHAVRDEVLTFEEVATLVRAFARWGVERVRLTGGEPTVRRGLPDLVAMLRDIPVAEDPSRRVEVVLTTNGSRLVELAQPLRAAGLTGLTVSLDSLRADRFAEITRRGDLPQVLAGIAAASAAGFRGIKINTVAVRGFNDDELGALALWAWEHGHVPRFIELMPMSGGRLFVPGELLAAHEIRAAVAAAAGGALVADDGGVARGLGPATYWRVADGPHAGRRLGVIAPMTENFCAGCNRLRISASGRLHNCLARDDTGDLRSVLRTGPADPNALETRVRLVLGHKQDGHGFTLDGRGGPEKPMIGIGG
jgi:cyclic pyranopterin phosphate synthase